MILITALITPFTEDNKIDYESFDRVLEYQKEKGINDIVLFGSTGEGFSLSMEEKKEILEYIGNKHNDLRVIVNVGGNNIDRVKEEISEIIKYNYVKKIMISTPYYLKPCQEGLYKYFVSILSEFKKTSFILYNVPSRTCVNLLPETIIRIRKVCCNIGGIKEASGDLKQIKELVINNFIVYSGDDENCLEGMRLGCNGLISVASNIYINEMIEVMRGNKLMNEIMSDRYRLLFLESNPKCIKYIMYKSNLIKNNILRLPLVEISEDNKNRINESLEFV